MCLAQQQHFHVINLRMRLALAFFGNNLVRTARLFSVGAVRFNVCKALRGAGRMSGMSSTRSSLPNLEVSALAD